MDLVTLLIIYIFGSINLVNGDQVRLLNSSLLQLRRLNNRERDWTGGTRRVGVNLNENANEHLQIPRLDNRISVPQIQTRENTRGPRRRQKCRKIEIENGVTQLKQRGAFVKYFCSSGFQMIGHNYDGCSDQGQWSQPAPFCARTGCRQTLSPINGEALTSYGGSVVDFTCDEGYQLIGSSVLFCDGNRWNGSEPACERIPLPIVTLLTPPPTTIPPRPTDPSPVMTTTLESEIDIGLNGSWGQFSPQDLGPLTGSTTQSSMNVTIMTTNNSSNSVTNLSHSAITATTEKLTMSTIKIPLISVDPIEATTPQVTPQVEHSTTKTTQMTSTTTISSTPIKENLTTNGLDIITNNSIVNETTKLFSTTELIPNSTLIQLTTLPNPVNSTMKSPTTFFISKNTTIKIPTTTKISTVLPFTATSSTKNTTKSILYPQTRRPFNYTLCTTKNYYQTRECRNYIIGLMKNRIRFPTTIKYFPNYVPSNRTTTVRPSTIMTTTGTTTIIAVSKITSPNTTQRIFTLKPTTTTKRSTTTKERLKITTNTFKIETRPSTTTTATTRRKLRIETTDPSLQFDNTIDQVLNERKKNRHELISPFHIDDHTIIEGTKYSQDSSTHHNSILITFTSLFCIAISFGISFLFYYCWRRNKGIARPSKHDPDGRNLSVIHDTDDDFVYMHINSPL